MAKPARTVTAPIGEVRRFEMPYTAAPGRLVNTDLGLRSIAVRAGDHAPYTIDVTLLDAPDHRLIRAGVWLGHRVLDGRGEWYLASDEWTPWLPAERIEQMGDVDLPDVFADLVRPFRRGAPLGPIAALNCNRQEFALRGPEAELLAVLRNDRVQIRCGGLVTARYREITLAAVADRLTGPQLAWLTEMLTAVGAIRVAAFPPLAQRLGAPASGLSDFPPPRECRPGDSLELVWTHRLGSRLRALTYADLAVRAGVSDAVGELRDHLLQVRTQLLGLTPLLDEGWAGDLVSQLDWAVQTLVDPTVDPAAVLSSENYLRLLDRLVTASRAPALGDHGTRPGTEALAKLLASRLERFVAATGRLRAGSADTEWQEALRLAALLLDCCAAQVRPDRFVLRLARRADPIVDLLAECVQAAEVYADLRLGELSSSDAFEAGRAYERLHVEQQIARLDFLDQWPSLARTLSLREDKQ